MARAWTPSGEPLTPHGRSKDPVQRKLRSGVAHFPHFRDRFAQVDQRDYTEMRISIKNMSISLNPPNLRNRQ
jgi:hypothetical protein